MELSSILQIGRENQLLVNHTRNQYNKLQIQADFNIVLIFASIALLLLLVIITFIIQNKSKAAN